MVRKSEKNAIEGAVSKLISWRQRVAVFKHSQSLRDEAALREASVGEVPGAVPEPPACVDNSAKPMLGGSALKTEYTFFKNVAPIIQPGFPLPTGILLPIVKSKIAPAHCCPVLVTGPKFISSGLITQVLPPKLSVTFTWVRQGNSQRPWLFCARVAPGTADQILATSSEGPPIRVVPVSMAESADDPPAIETGLPWTVTVLRGSSQYVGVVPNVPLVSKSKNSISPLNKEELVPPSVKTPPSSISFARGSLLKRVIQKENSGASSWPSLWRLCQNGVPPVLAMAEKARPRIPDVCPLSKPDCSRSTATVNPVKLRPLVTTEKRWTRTERLALDGEVRAHGHGVPVDKPSDGSGAIRDAGLLVGGLE